MQLLATLSKPGRITAAATVDRATARRLELGRKRTVGSGRRTATRAATLKVNVKLTKKARKGLKRQKRTLRINVRVRFVPADGTRAVTRTISLLLRPAD